MTIGPKPNPRPIILHVDSETGIPYRLAESDSITIANINVDTINGSPPGTGGGGGGGIDPTAINVTSLQGTSVLITTGTNVTSLNGTSVFETQSNAAATYLTQANAATTYVAIPGGLASQDILYYNGSVWDNLPKGSNGEYLQIDGAGNLNWNPVCGTVSIPVLIEQGGTNTTTPPPNGGVIYFDGTRYNSESAFTYDATNNRLSVCDVSLTSPLATTYGGTGRTSLGSVSLLDLCGTLTASRGGTGKTSLGDLSLLDLCGTLTTSRGGTGKTSLGDLSLLDLCGTLTTSRGGTGLTTLPGTGELLVGNAGTYQLQSGSTLRNSIGLGSVSIENTVPINKGGTNATATPTTNGVIYFDGSKYDSEAGFTYDPGTNTLSVNTITPTTPIATQYGGTGKTSLGSVDLGDFCGTLPVSKGGTGRSTLTAGDLLVGNDAGQVSLLSQNKFEVTSYSRSNYLLTSVNVTSLNGTGIFEPTSAPITQLRNYATGSLVAGKYGAIPVVGDNTFIFLDSPTSTYGKFVKSKDPLAPDNPNIIAQPSWELITTADVQGLNAYATTASLSNYLVTGTNVTSLNGTGTFETQANAAATYIQRPSSPVSQDLLYYNAGGNWARFPRGLTGQYLKVDGGGLLSWGEVCGTVSIPVLISEGGTNATATPTTNGVIYYNGTRYDSESGFTYNPGTDTLTVNTLNTTTPIATQYGGTGKTSLTSIDLGDFCGTLPVTKGGTGRTTLTAGDLLVGNDGGQVTLLSQNKFEVTSYSRTNYLATSVSVTSLNGTGVFTTTSFANANYLATGTNVTSLNGTGVFTTTSFANANYLVTGTNVTSLNGTGTFETTGYSRSNYLLTGTSVTSLNGTGVFETTGYARSNYLATSINVTSLNGTGVFTTTSFANSNYLATGTNVTSLNGTGTFETTGYARSNYLATSINVTSLNGTGVFTTTSFANANYLVTGTNVTSLNGTGLFETTGYARSNYFTTGTNVTSLNGTGVFTTTSFANANYFNKNSDTLSIARGGTGKTSFSNKSIPYYNNSTTSFDETGNLYYDAGTTSLVVANLGLGSPLATSYGGTGKTMFASGALYFSSNEFTNSQALTDLHNYANWDNTNPLNATANFGNLVFVGLEKGRLVTLITGGPPNAGKVLTLKTEEYIPGTGIFITYPDWLPSVQSLGELDNVTASTVDVSAFLPDGSPFVWNGSTSAWEGQNTTTFAGVIAPELGTYFVSAGGGTYANSNYRVSSLSAINVSATNISSISFRSSNISATNVSSANLFVGSSHAGGPTMSFGGSGGVWYRNPEVLGTRTMSTNGVQYTPLYIAAPTTFDRMAVRFISTTGVVGTSQVRLGIYSDYSGTPDSLVLDAGTIAFTSATGASVSSLTINQTLSPGWYWLAGSFSSTTGFTMRGYTAYSNSNYYNPRMIGDPNSDSIVNALFDPNTSYAVNPFPSKAGYGNANGWDSACIFLRKA